MADNNQNQQNKKPEPRQTVSTGASGVTNVSGFSGGGGEMVLNSNGTNEGTPGNPAHSISPQTNSTGKDVNEADITPIDDTAGAAHVAAKETESVNAVATAQKMVNDDLKAKAENPLAAKTPKPQDILVPDAIAMADSKL